MPRGRGMPPMQVPVGTAFADLKVVREIEPSGTNRRVLCVCMCGNETVKFLNNLRAGRSTSCGCAYDLGAVGRAASVAARRQRAQITVDGRMCHTCGTWKTWDHFRADPRRPEQRASNCIDCARWRGIRARYGIGRDEWEELRDTQGGCALCGDVGELSVDHDHACCGINRGCRNCLRGLLCDFCNRVLGRIEQKPALAERFADYLQRRPFRPVGA